MINFEERYELYAKFSLEIFFDAANRRRCPWLDRSRSAAEDQ